jgi:hypothetical protein
MPAAPTYKHTGMSLDEALARINELEDLLENATYGAPAEWRAVYRAFNVSPSQAMILVCLAKAPAGLAYAELDTLLPSSFTNGTRKDPEFRTLGTIKNFVYEIRRKLPWALVRSDRWNGVRLTDEGRERVLAQLSLGGGGK